MRGQYIKWAEPKYGASPGPDIYPEPQKKASEDWPSEWFYMEDAPLLDPVRIGLPEFSNAPLKKRRNWRPWSPQVEDNGEVLYPMNRIKALALSGLTVIEVMSTCIMRGVQPLQYRGKPMWHFNGEDDASRCGRKGPDSATALAKILSDLYKGEEEEFLCIKPRGGLSMYNPPSWASCYLFIQLHSFTHSSSQIFTLPIHSRNCEKL